MYVNFESGEHGGFGATPPPLSDAGSWCSTHVSLIPGFPSSNLHKNSISYGETGLGLGVGEESKIFGLLSRLFGISTCLVCANLGKADGVVLDY